MLRPCPYPLRFPFTSYPYPLSSGSHVTSRARSCSVLESCPWLELFCLYTQRSRSAWGFVLLCLYQLVTSDYKYTTLKAQLTAECDLHSGAPLWKMDGEQCTGFCQRSVFLGLPTNSYPTSPLLDLFLLEYSLNYFSANISLSFVWIPNKI